MGTVYLQATLAASIAKDAKKIDGFLDIKVWAKLGPF